MKVSVSYVAKATAGRITRDNSQLVINNVSIDSRKIPEHCLYIPIVGERNDGHTFIESAIQNGAEAFVYDPTRFDISTANIPEGVAAIEVNDTWHALANLASQYRIDLGVKVIAVTGSVGKTTTKEFLYSVLSIKFKTSKTQGNLNNQYGVPLTLLAIPDDTEYAIVEMGMNHFGEISLLSKIARPDYAVISNIGVAHIENLGSRRGIFRAKMEVVDGMKTSGTLVVNGDDDMLRTLPGKVPQRVATFGLDRSCDRAASQIEVVRDGVTFVAMHQRFNIHIPGKHNVYDAMAAISLGEILGMSTEEMCVGVSRCKGEANRMQLTESEGIVYINDAYNANPVSMKAAIDTICEMPCDGRRIVVLGDMFELGEQALDMHKEIGKYCANSRVDILVSAGSFAKDMVAEAKENGLDDCYAAADALEAGEIASKLVRYGDTVLFKGSRGMTMEKSFYKVLGE